MRTMAVIEDSLVLFESANLVIREGEWLSPNTYDANFCPVPNNPGIYLLVAYDVRPCSIDRIGIVYVGSASNLCARYQNHETLRRCRRNFDYVRFYFREELEYQMREKQLIQTIKPRFNIQYAK